ncbi:hypothetical protein IMZ48_49040, partial [Candidatus Bathyarchaeota archaeon]|nr:hypothetical protein [Candidatus Bathyarchaeota archaeon]
MALLGIASVMEEGILQGDLTRLVGQDKRSLPKRTDELARKGYVEKKPILARRCKTSKIWLKAFAPSTPSQSQPAEAKAEAADDDFPRAALVTDLEPVPWRDHWTGSTIDYAMLGRTIMAVIREFGVIRYADLRVKLGVSGVHWQMKVVTRTCRFFIELGLIEYVTASLGNRLYRDCLKFKRHLTTEDLSTFISGGGATFRFGNNHEPRKVRPSKKPDDDTVDESPAETWNPDKPLTISILQTILASGEHGIANKGLAFHTIGGCLERHVSAVSTAVSVKNSQPAHLQHLQARKEYCRTGRVAAYRFFSDTPVGKGPQLLSQNEGDGAEVPESSDSIAVSAPPASGNDYGFRAVELKPKPRPAKTPKLEISSTKRPRDVEDNESRKRRKTDATNDVSNGEKSEYVQTPIDPRVYEPEDGEEVIVASTLEEVSRGPKKGKRGRGRKSATDGENFTPSAKSKGTRWVCRKCGGSWKNDIGLKYHLTKSQTSCNVAFVENPQPRASRKPRGGRGRQAPRAVYRLGECKVLAQRKWKGDTALEVRQESALDDVPSGPIWGAHNHAQSRSNQNSLFLSTISMGGFVESPLARLQDAATVSSSLNSKPSDSAKARPRGSTRPLPLIPTSPSRQATPQGTPLSANRASNFDTARGPGEASRSTPEQDEGGTDYPLI